MDHVTIEGISIAFTGIVLIWLGRQVTDTRDICKAMHVSLFGIDGRDGMRGDMTALEARMLRLEKALFTRRRGDSDEVEIV